MPRPRSSRAESVIASTPIGVPRCPSTGSAKQSGFLKNDRDCVVADAPRNDNDRALSETRSQVLQKSNGHWGRRQLNVHSARSLPKARPDPKPIPEASGSRRNSSHDELKSRKLNLPQAAEAQSSAGSSPSASRSGVPARICSAISPEFCRIAISILAVMSGLARRNVLAFSRPCPSRWLS